MISNRLGNQIWIIFWSYMSTHGKAPVVPFHEITSLYSYFEEIWIFAPIQSATEKTEKIIFCFRTELKTKSLFTTTSNVLPFKFKYWQQKFCRLKLIPWNLVNLSHLYIEHTYLGSLTKLFLLKFNFYEKDSKICVIFLMVLKFT